MSITPHLYPVAMPFVQVAPMQNQGGGGPPYSAYSMGHYNGTESNSFMSTHAPMDGNNRNNNNNTTFATYAGFGNHMMAVNPVFIPQSPGFFLAPTGKAFFLA